MQRMGAVYIQDAACLLPARPELQENMQYVATTIEEMGGSCHLFGAVSLLPDGPARLKDEFRAQADRRLEDITVKLDSIRATLDAVASPADLERAEEEIKRERVAYLRARRLAYFGSSREAEVDSRLDALKGTLDDLYRSGK